MTEFLGGAVTLGYLAGAVFFLRFWRRTGDRLFGAFSAAFFLLALNQLLAHVLSVISEPSSFVYALRVLAFILILGAIIDKNVGRRAR